MIRGVIFDLDGVLVSTDECHFRAWKRMADEEGIPFSREDNARLRGVSRMQSLDIILERAEREYSPDEKDAMAARKNAYYVDLIGELDASSMLPGALDTVRALRDAGIRTAIGSSSRNAPLILDRLGIRNLFDAVADGNQIRRSKPAPDVFLLAAELLGLSPEECVVVEDADAGVEAALSAGMRVLGVGEAHHHPRAHLRAESLQDANLAAWVAEENRR
ncbi:MAG TPA: beta-phosphoglucomutase [Candidatus Limnocylindria bacterium]|nr:beta-phosphoglucomutase [Candidatus Limnocylindria bacterium]